MSTRLPVAVIDAPTGVGVGRRRRAATRPDSVTLDANARPCDLCELRLSGHALDLGGGWAYVCAPCLPAVERGDAELLLDAAVVAWEEER